MLFAKEHILYVPAKFLFVFTMLKWAKNREIDKRTTGRIQEKFRFSKKVSGGKTPFGFESVNAPLARQKMVN